MAKLPWLALKEQGRKAGDPSWVRIIASVSVDFSNVTRVEELKDLNKKETKLLDDYEIISSEEMEKYLKNKEGDINEKNE